MSGSPLHSLALVVLLLSLLAIPLRRLGQDRAVEAPLQTSVDAVPKIGSQVRVRFTHLPVSAVVSTQGKPVATWQAAVGRDWSFREALEIYEDQIELALTVTWPEGSPETATQLFLTPDGLEEKSQTYWCSGMLDEVLLFSWKPANPPSLP